jgi:putative spermidine/putrescine transport system permease protein
VILKTVVGLIYAFLLLPMVIVVLAAFNAGNYFTFPPQGFSLKWFANFFQRREFMQALWLSTELAVWTALASTVIGTAAAIPLVRGRFRGRDLLNAFVTSPLQTRSHKAGSAVSASRPVAGSYPGTPV